MSTFVNRKVEIEGLRTGQIIRIPKKTKLVEADLPIDSLVYESHIDRTDYYEELEVIKLEEYFHEMRKFNRERLKVAYFIPFDYYPEIIDTIIELEEGEEPKKITLEEERMKALPKSVNFLEFFEGSLMAIDKLKNEGVNIEVQYFDPLLILARKAIRRAGREPVGLMSTSAMDLTN